MLTYNQERYINEAIRSVMLQETNFPFELVIGNDASTDCTGTICADWQKKYPEQIVLFNRKKNLGLQQNFIQTYAQCRGQYIAICEGDDFWTDKRKLQIQADFLDTHPDYSTCFHRVIKLLRRPRNQEPQQWRAEAGYRHIRPCTQQLHLQRIRFVPPGLVRRTARMVCPCQHLRLCHTFAECTIREDTLYKASDGRLPPTRKSNLE